MKNKFMKIYCYYSCCAALVFIVGCAQTHVSSYSFTGGGSQHLTAEQSEEAESIIKILEKIHEGIISNDLSILTNYVNSEKGIYIDLKAHKSFVEMSNQIKDENSYLNIFFLNTQKLKEITKDSNQISIKDILSGQKHIRIELYFNEKNDECEAKIILQKKKDLDYRLNNPYFIKINKKWYIYRLM